MGETADLIRQVSDEKVSVSEPLMTHRNMFQLLSKRVEACTARISVDETCLRTTWQPVYRRHESSQASIRNVGTWLGMLRERIKWLQP